jgi:hypothetical protein
VNPLFLAENQVKPLFQLKPIFQVKPLFQLKISENIISTKINLSARTNL